MHFEILVEDISGKAALERLIPKIIGEEHSVRIHAYKGIGSIPKDLKPNSDPEKRILLNQLPKLIRGYGKTFLNFSAALIIVCDLDARDREDFLSELNDCLQRCDSKPETYFCLAIEEGEAWLLGDIHAVKAAYPKAKDMVLNSYVNDSICGTWEKLADAVFPGGSKKLASMGWQMVGKEKSDWATKISFHMDIENNSSPSFCYFQNTLNSIISNTEI